MQNIALEGGPIEVVGALELDHTPTGLVPRRLPAWTRPQIPDLFMDVVVQLPSGVRLRFATSSTRVELDVMLTNLSRPPMPQMPAVFDLVINGEVVSQQQSTEGHLIILGPNGPADISFAAGEPTTLTFQDLPSGMKVVEIWLPQASGVELRTLRIEDGASAAAAAADPNPYWVHYGSSISHCIEATSPTATWPAVAAHQAGVKLHSLGLAGQCMLDQFVARTIADLPADVISLKVGINVVNGDTLRERTFGPALHGFLDTIRAKQPDTPILLVSPIFCPSAEDRPGPTIPNAEGNYITVDGLDDLRLTCLTLKKIRTAMSSIVDVRRGLGDMNLHYLNGLDLFGADDAGDLHDDLHPTAAGYVRIGQRFAELAFGTGGPLASAG